MPVNVNNISSLKTVSADSKKLRWVDTEKAWFQSEPASTDTPDDVNIVAPNAGGGRWLKQYAVNSNNQALTWVTRTADFSAIANYGYFVDTSSGIGNVVATLPASPSIGQTISFVYVGTSSVIKKLRINRNGKPINGLTFDVQLTRQAQKVTLTYVDSSFGWVAESPSRLDYFQASVSFAAPASTNLAQNGIVNYLGTELGTMSYVNPALANGGRPGRLKFITASNISNYTSITDRASNGNTWFSGQGGGCQGILVAFYRTDTLEPIQVKLSTLFIDWMSGSQTSITADAGYCPPVLTISGASSLGNNLTLADIQALTTTFMWASTSEIRHLTSPPWEELANFRNNTVEGSQSFYKSTTSTTAKLYPINSSDFYPYYLISGVPAVLTSSNFGFSIHEMEFYGEVIAT